MGEYHGVSDAASIREIRNDNLENHKWFWKNVLGEGLRSVSSTSVP